MKKRIVFLLAVVMVLALAFAACENLPAVTFVAQNEAEETKEVPFDDNFQIPTFTNGDKLFGGWYTDEACSAGKEWTKPDALTESVTVYAKWIDTAGIYESISAEINGAKVVLSEQNATETDLRAALKILGKKGAESVVITDYKIENFDATKIGQDQEVTIKYGSLSCKVTVQVSAVASNDLADILPAYSDVDAWNFRVNFFCYLGEQVYDATVLEYADGNVKMTYEVEGEKHTDYLVYDAATDSSFYCMDNGDGTYTKIDETDPWFELYVQMSSCADLSAITADMFELGEDKTYAAIDAQQIGNALLGDYGEGCTWTSVTLKVNGGKIVGIEAVQEDTTEEYADTYTYSLSFESYDAVSIELPDFDAQPEPVENDKELADVLASYADEETWNFKISYKEFDDGEATPVDDVELRYNGMEFSMKYLMEDGSFRTDYVLYSPSDEQHIYYLDEGGTYKTYKEYDNEDEFYTLYNETYYFALSALANFQFEKVGDHYSATKPDNAAPEFMGAYDGEVYSALDVYIADGRITKIVSASDVDGIYGAWTAEYVFEFGEYDEVTLTAPEVGDDNPGGDDNPVKMPK